MRQPKVLITKNGRTTLAGTVTRLRNWGDTPPEHLRALEERLEDARSSIPWIFLVRWSR